MILDYWISDLTDAYLCIIADVNAITALEKVNVVNEKVSEKVSEKESEKTSVGEAKAQENGVAVLPYQPERSETQVTNDSEKGELPGYEEAPQLQDVIRNGDGDGDAAQEHPKSELDTQVDHQQSAPEEPVEYFEPRAAYDFADEDDVDSASEYSNESGVGADEDEDDESSGKYYYETRGRLTPCAEDEELDEFEGHENEDAEDLERVWVEVLEEQRRRQEANSAVANATGLTTSKSGQVIEAKEKAGVREKEQVTKKTKRKSAREVGGKSEGTPFTLNFSE